VGRRKKRRKKWFNLEPGAKAEQPQEIAEGSPGVEVESPPVAPAGAAGASVVEGVAEADVSPDGEECADLRAEPTPQTETGEAAHVSEVLEDVEAFAGEVDAEAGAGLAVGGPENGDPAPVAETSREVQAHLVAGPPGDTEAQGSAEVLPELEMIPEEDEAALRDHRTETRRQYARFVVGGKTVGRVTAIYDAVVLDISMGGSLIEHAHVVRPGTMSSLDLELGGARVRLRCRVARSVVHRSEVLPGGERELIYRTGLQFLDPPEETRQMIIQYIRSVIRPENSG
jgi:hypothetical protein